MTTTTPTAYSDQSGTAHEQGRRVWTFTETKAGVKTTEFLFMVLFIVGVLIATYVDGNDSLQKDDGWFYAAIVASAYFISRGLAKAGTREPYTTDRT